MLFRSPMARIPEHRHTTAKVQPRALLWVPPRQGSFNWDCSGSSAGQPLVDLANLRVVRIANTTVMPTAHANAIHGSLPAS
jgi:hypothetical protein